MQIHDFLGSYIMVPNYLFVFLVEIRNAFQIFQKHFTF